MPFKDILCSILVIFNLQILSAQYEIKSNNEKSIAIGYIYNSYEEVTKDFHLLELEYWHTQYSTYPHYFVVTKYAGLEIGLNTDTFVIGPKFGASLNYGPIIIGMESLAYTNFDETTLRIAPIFGYGNHRFKLSFSVQIRIINRSFIPTNLGQFNFAMKIATFKNSVN